MNPYKTVYEFESIVAEHCGSEYAVAVDSCTNAIFLCCKYLNVDEVLLPKLTYISVLCSVVHAGGKVKWHDLDWKQDRHYRLDPYPIYDAAHYFQENMYVRDTFFCLSFSATKKINIGKGGMILTDDTEAVKWFRKARYCGRNEVPLINDNIDMLGWNMYMTPEQAARGIMLMHTIDERPYAAIPDYPDLSSFTVS